MITRVPILFSILATISLATVSFTHGAEKIQYMSERNPPYNFEKDRKAQGLAVDLLVEMGKQAGHPVIVDEIRMLPWPRGYRTLIKKPRTALFSMARTEQREKLFKWVGPIIDLTISLIAAKEKKFIIESPEDFRDLRIGTILDSSSEQLLIETGFAPDKFQRTPSLEQNIKKLAVDRLDALAFNASSTRYTMKTLGLDPDDYEIVFVLTNVSYYYAYSKDTDDTFIKDMNTALRSLKKEDKEGTSFYDRLVASWLDDE